MKRLPRCSSCGGFVPEDAVFCPHCSRSHLRLRTIALGALGVAGGGAIAVTLMACYGAACVDGSGACVPYNPDASDAGDGSDGHPE